MVSNSSYMLGKTLLKKELSMLCSMHDDMIYTSYFGNVKKILEEVPDAGLISIAGKTPDWFKGEKFKPLMPHYDWWKEWHDTFEGSLDSKESREWYIDKYNKTVLSSLDPVHTERALKDLVHCKPTFILCYETPEKFCHRHIVAEWFNNYCIPCEEWKAR